MHLGILQIVVVARRVELQCRHRLCHAPDGHARHACIFAAIERADDIRQLDGEPADERGRTPHMTVEAIARVIGVSTRKIEQDLASAMSKLRGNPRARELLELWCAR